MAGVKAGMKNTWCEFRMPITNPLNPKITTEGSMMSSNFTVRASWTGLSAKPGASTECTSGLAKMAVMIAARLSTINTRLPMAEASLQAEFRSPLVNNPVKVGMKADPSAPPAMSRNKVSETRLAARKASISACVPNVVAFRIRLARLIKLLNNKAIITVPADRAI